MVPVDRPIIAPPAIKKNIIDIPAANGQVDLLNALVGYPVYKNRTGALKFTMVNKSSMTVQNRVNEIARHLHGIYMQMILDEEPAYYFNGYYEVTGVTFRESGQNADITIKYDVEPYKYAVSQTDDEWLWDTFNLETGVIPHGTIVNATVRGIADGGITLTDIGAWVGSKTVTPQVVISGAATPITFRVYNSQTGQWTESVYTNGTDQSTSGTLRFDRFSERLQITGYGTYSIIFRAGVL